MNKFFKLGIGFLLSAAGLYYAFRNIDLNEFLSQLSMVNMVYILIATGLLVYSVLVRAQRWKLILISFEHIPLHPLFRSTMIGYFGNSVLPFRMGEVLRGYDLAKTSSVSFSAAFGTIVLERILDMLGLIVVIGFFMIFYPLAEWMSGVAYGVIILTILVFIIILWFGKNSTGFQDKLSRRKFAEHPFGRKIVSIISNLFDGITAIKGTRHTGMITLQTLFLWMIYYCYSYIVAQAVSVDINWIEVGIILIATTFSIMLPAAPGYIGTYHAVVVYVAITLFAIPKSEAQAFAVIIHGVGYLPFVIIGSVYFLKSSVRLSDVKIMDQS